MLLLSFLSGQSRIDGDSIEIISTFFLFIGIFLHVVLHACHITECRHQIIKRQLMVINLSGFYFTRPANNKRNADTSFVTLTLQTAQLTVTSKECRICTTFLVRTVIAGKDNQCIFIHSLFFQLLQYFTHIMIQTGNHTGKLRMCMNRSIVARTFRTSPCLVMEELFLISFQNRILRLN